LGASCPAEKPDSSLTGEFKIIEVQSGSYLCENDIVRFEDNYGRGGK